MKLTVIGGKTAAWPRLRIGAIESQRVAIMTIDIHGSFTRTWDIVSRGRGIIADKRNNDTRLASLILDVLHIAGVGKVIVSTASTRVFVLRLIENDRSAICDLGLGNGRRSVGHVTVQIVRLDRPQGSPIFAMAYLSVALK